ncbi:MAG: helix-turn-helix transcriptional regulator [Acholeplasmatales bacterium]|nr:helix-turn-helix transcriptional regulator [Acholeplasmatales bacterium]
MYLKKLKDLREDHDYTQKYVASVLNISQNSYSDIETGKTNISIESLIKLADLYNVTLDYLVDRKK